MDRRPPDPLSTSRYLDGTVTDVLIVGAGPVGLDLANRLLLDGRTVAVLDARPQIGRHSRSIGIHAPSLEILAETNVADDLIKAGLRVKQGMAFAGERPIGELGLDAGPPPYQFVLTIPQYRTEEILQHRTGTLSPGTVHRGVAVQTIRQDELGVTAVTSNGTQWRARFAVGCDGQNSVVRQALGVDFPGGPYSDTFAMGDFHDDSGLGPQAGIFLTTDGLVESFPLPGDVRRWVVRLLESTPDISARDVARIVSERTGFFPNAETASMTSGFQVFRHLASTMHVNRILLAGDAAHVVSPIGGQGMNIGWLDGRDAAVVLAAALDGEPHAAAFSAYSTRRRRTAQKAARRAEFNMLFGRPGPLAPLARLAARVMLRPPFAGYFARQFTMRGLK
jgi:2-polyprenyl-6-methoxyphenol hydroxylase-like FAD-dependent oxidoreductase